LVVSFSLPLLPSYPSSSTSPKSLENYSHHQSLARSSPSQGTSWTILCFFHLVIIVSLSFFLCFISTPPFPAVILIDIPGSLLFQTCQRSLYTKVQQKIRVHENHFEGFFFVFYYDRRRIESNIRTA